MRSVEKEVPDKPFDMFSETQALEITRFVGIMKA